MSSLANRKIGQRHFCPFRRFQIVPRILPAILLICILLGAYFIYRPGLPGPFLLDDAPNLQSLSSIGGEDSAARTLAFLETGRSGPTGRPLSLISFLVDDNAWPSDPLQFKRTNVLLHILTGALLAWLSLRLALAYGISNRWAPYVALIAAALWLVHPLNVSTALYVVQRMTILSALFVASGLLMYVHGRTLLPSKPYYGLTWMFGALFFCTLLATLSKENGVLLPVYALLTEVFFFKSVAAPVPQALRNWRFPLLYAPSLALLAYLLSTIPTLGKGYELRTFTVGERILTEARILLEYLGQILVPRIQGSGLFHDDYVISRGLLDPPETAICIAAWVVLVALAVYLRRTHFLLLFSIMWFLAGHVLESTIFPLELYFEHRNYLPMFGILFAVACTPFCRTWTPNLQVATRSFLVALAMTYGTMTFGQARVWGSPLALAAVWSDESPGSARAQQMAANLWLSLGDYQRARDGLVRAYVAQQDNPGLLVQVLQVSCLQGGVTPGAIDEAMSALKNHKSGNSFADVSLDSTIPKLYGLAQRCPPLSTDVLDELVSMILKNPFFGSDLKSKLYYLRGKQYADRRQLDPAMAMLDAAFDLRPNVDIALLQSYWLMTAGLYDDALAYAEKASQQDSAGRWPFRNLRTKDVAALRLNIMQLRARRSST